MVAQFRIRPTIQRFSLLSEFLHSAALTPNDCLFTIEPIYKAWLKDKALPCRCLLFDHYGTGEPTMEMIDLILADFHKTPCQRVIAIGGGSVLDIAKILGLKRVNGSALDLFDNRFPLIKEREVILVPTTCGTGSEVTCIAVSGIPSRKTKKGLAADPLFADAAILIPELIGHLPHNVLITSSLDALTHAMESFVSPKSTPFSEMFSLTAIRILLKTYRSLSPKNSLQQVDDLLFASNLAGIAFSNAGVGMIHALAYPLGGQYHVVHGEACARFLSAVFTWYRDQKPQGKLQELTHTLMEALECASGKEAWDHFDALLQKLLPPKKLRDYGMTREDIDLFADSVIKEQQRLLVNNYIPASRDNLRDIYKKLW